MALPTTGFSAIGVEDIEWSEFSSAWFLKYMDEISNRKYFKNFSSKYTEVVDWAFAHKDMVWDTPFEEQEKMMIADGVLSESDI